MIYDGILDQKKMPSIALRAYQSWKNQRQRCSNPNIKAYKSYGGKKIVVRYSSREFIGWFIENVSSDNLKSAVVGRIDHSKDYTLDNIKIETKSESTNEMLTRNRIRKKVVVLDAKTRKQLTITESAYHAARLTGYSQCNINEICRGQLAGKKSKPMGALSFKFLGE